MGGAQRTNHNVGGREEGERRKPQGVDGEANLKKRRTGHAERTNMTAVTGERCYGTAKKKAKAFPGRKERGGKKRKKRHPIIKSRADPKSEFTKSLAFWAWLENNPSLSRKMGEEEKKQ